jgi:hypothetical protein
MKTANCKKSPPLKKRSYGLTKMSDLRTFMSVIINAAHKDQISESKLRSLSYAIQILAKILESSDIEQRLEELEKAIYHGKQAA